MKYACPRVNLTCRSGVQYGDSTHNIRDVQAWYHLHNILNRSGCRLYNMNSDKMVTHSSFILLSYLHTSKRVSNNKRLSVGLSYMKRYLVTLEVGNKG